ncbi:hypothetical protein GCM10010402_81150 [Actinomadura luteofluorescens]|uniref:DUF3592 domain-containing protein n=1 Tax=Actinomadura luteofluorescens TaxID=46163 RepID=UPI0021644625|nr:DUF3592 domain-containing protein [Actinomadura glauciflava]MCR3738640.1 Protein of unknown function (DUF3592) [Actinomadura glauciflava]
MPKVRSRRHRPVHIVCVVIASVTGLLSVVWFGGTIAAWAGQAGKPKATARILDISGANRSSGHLVVEFTTGNGRRVRAEEKRRGWPSDVRQGAAIEVVYDPDDPSDVQPFQDLKKALPPVALFTVAAGASGAGAYRTRARPSAAA